MSSSFWFVWKMPLNSFILLLTYFPCFILFPSMKYHFCSCYISMHLMDRSIGPACSNQAKRPTTTEYARAKEGNSLEEGLGRGPSPGAKGQAIMEVHPSGAHPSGHGDNMRNICFYSTLEHEYFLDRGVYDRCKHSTHTTLTMTHTRLKFIEDT